MPKEKSAVPMVGLDKKWQAADDLRTLHRADEIKHDKGRLKAVESLVKKEVKLVGKLKK